MIGAVFLGWAWTHATGTDGWIYHGVLLLAALSVAAVLAHLATSPDGLTARILSVPPLPALGLISYGVYLWHWPVFLAVDGRTTGLVGTRLWVVRCGITIAIACASYFLVEQPIRRAHRLQPSPATFAAAASAVMVVAVLPFAPWLGASRVQAAGGDLAEARPAGGLERLLTDQTASAPAHPHRARDADGSRPAAVPAARHWRPGTRLVVDVFGDSLPWGLVAALPARPGSTCATAPSGCGIVFSAPYQYSGRYPHVYRAAGAGAGTGGRP